MDLLSDVLRDLRLESAVLSVGEFRAPWGIDKGVMGREGGAPFHIVVEGRCLFEIEGNEPRELEPGDLVVLPHGSAHTLVSDRRVRRRTPFGQVLAQSGVETSWAPGQRLEKLGQIRFGGEGALTRIINGVFTFGDRRRNPLLQALPAVIHIKGRMGRRPDWLAGPLDALIDETLSGKPGFQTVAERLSDIIFVQAVRDYIANTSAIEASWLCGLADPRIGHALALVHAEPSRPWTVGSLAEAVALSRTVFANRFRDLVGSTVMDYVTALRMYVAAGRLSNSSDTLARIANSVGYESDISFSRAFRRWAGMPPGQYRRQMTVAAAPATIRNFGEASAANQDSLQPIDRES